MNLAVGEGKHEDLVLCAANTRNYIKHSSRRVILQAVSGVRQPAKVRVRYPNEL